MTQPDYYELLQVHPKASLAVIKKAYRTLMLDLGAHPDRGGDEATAALITEAFAVLSDPVRRAAYDRELGEPPPPAEPAEPPAPAPTAGTALIVLCPRCRTKNRVRSQDLLAVAKCSKCGQGLSRMPNVVADALVWAAGGARRFGDAWRDARRPPKGAARGRMSPWIGVALPVALIALSVGAAGYALTDMWGNHADPVEAATVLVKEGKYTQAAEALNRSIYRNNTNAKLYGMLGDVSLHQHDHRRALENYVTAAQLAPTDAIYWAAQGNVYLELKEIPKAEKAFNQALHVDKQCTVALVGMGNIAAKAKDLKMAQKFYRDALQYTAGGGADIWYNLGLVYEWDKKPEQAVHAYQQALMADADHRSAMVSLAALYYTQHRYDMAASLLMKATYLKSSDLDLHEKLADCFEHTGRRGEAIHEWTVCLEQAKTKADDAATVRARRALERLHAPTSG